MKYYISIIGNETTTIVESYDTMIQVIEAAKTEERKIEFIMDEKSFKAFMGGHSI